MTITYHEKKDVGYAVSPSETCPDSLVYSLAEAVLNKDQHTIRGVGFRKVYNVLGIRILKDHADVLLEHVQTVYDDE